MMGLMWLALASAAEPHCTVIRDAVVYTPARQEGWDLAWSEGKLTHVGPDAEVAEGCEVLSSGGAHVTAGLVATQTQLGLVEIELESSTRDDSWGGDPVRAALSVIDAYDPLSPVVDITRDGGITTAVLSPTGGFVSGQLGAVRLHGHTQDEARLPRELLRPQPFGRPPIRTQVESHGIEVRLGALGSRAAGLVRLTELLQDAVEHTRRRDEWSGVQELSASRSDLEALERVVAGKVPLVVHAERAADITALLRLRRQAARGGRPFDLVIVGASEGWLVADAIADAGVAVVIDPLVYGAGGYDQVRGRADNAARLADAGVAVILSAFDTHNARSLRFVAGNAVRGGLTHEAALGAITKVPAEVFGLPGRGALEVGAPADLAVWTADPLDIPARLLSTVIYGEVVAPGSRQRDLVEAYRTPGNKALLPPQE